MRVQVPLPHHASQTQLGHRLNKHVLAQTAIAVLPAPLEIHTGKSGAIKVLCGRAFSPVFPSRGVPLPLSPASELELSLGRSSIHQGSSKASYCRSHTPSPSRLHVQEEVDVSAAHFVVSHEAPFSREDARQPGIIALILVVPTADVSVPSNEEFRLHQVQQFRRTRIFHTLYRREAVEYRLNAISVECQIDGLDAVSGKE